MHEKIVVPLDGSEVAEVALPYAEELAGRLGSAVTLLHVCESADDPNRRMHQMYLEKLVDATKQGAESYMPSSERGKREVRVQTAMLTGNPAEEIIRYAEKEEAGLVIMATHGRSGIGRWALGSVADKIVRSAAQPVLLIRARGASAGVRARKMLGRVLIPLDGSKEGETALPCIAALVTSLSTEVTLLQVLALGYQTMTAQGYEYVIYPAQQTEADRVRAKGYLDGVAGCLKQPGMTVKSEVKFGNAADEIIKTADEINADLVAMATHGRSGLGRWVLGSVADRVLRSGNKPLLLVRVPGACAIEE